MVVSVPVDPVVAPGLAGLVFVSSADGVSEGLVRVRCVPAELLRPWALRRVLPFLIFASDVELSLFAELSRASTPAELFVPVPAELDAAPWSGTALDARSR